MKTLIIIGNGLDLNLGLKSRFIDFIYSPQYKSINVNYDIYNYEDWSDLENRYYEEIVNGSAGVPGCDIWFGNFKEVVRAFINYLDIEESKLESKGVNEIRNRHKNISKILNSAQCIINFNYTQTLEHIFKVRSEKINYIHGSIKEYKNNRDIVLGLSRDRYLLDIDPRGSFLSKRIQREILNFQRWYGSKYSLDKSFTNTFFPYLNSYNNFNYYYPFYKLIEGMYSILSRLNENILLNEEYWSIGNLKDIDNRIKGNKRDFNKLIGLPAYSCNSIILKNFNQSADLYTIFETDTTTKLRNSFKIKGLTNLEYELINSRKNYRFYNMKRRNEKSLKAYFKIMNLYFKSNNYIPFKINLNNLKIDEIEKIVIIGHSLDSKQINIYPNHEDKVVDDEEIFKELFTAPKLQNITFFSYSHDDLDIKRSIMSIKNLIGKKADKIQINYQFY